MKVTVDVGKREIELVFHMEAEPSHGEMTKWAATANNAVNTWIRFAEKDSVVGVITRSDDITTPLETLIERIQEALAVFRANNVSDMEPEDSDADVSDVIPYDPDAIKVRRDFLSAREICMIVEDRSLDLNPDFQRYFVWNNAQKSSFIESLLLGLPIPLFYFSENTDRTFNVIDGLQRLTTLYQFMQNEFPIKKVSRLDRRYEGKYYKPDTTKGIGEEKALDPPMRRRIEITQFVINVIEASSPYQVKFDIFQRLNSGGKHLNNQEIRNCIATPPVRKLLRDMVNNDLFRETTGNSVSSQRMDDQELALRFIGFVMVEEGKVAYMGNMTAFLGNVLDILKKDGAKNYSNYLSRFMLALENCQYAFGPYAFRKCLPEHLLPGAKKQTINKSLFTIWTITLSKYKDIKKMIGPEELAYLQAEKFIKEKEKKFLDSVTNKTNDKSVIESALKTVQEIAEQAILNPSSNI